MTTIISLCGSLRRGSFNGMLQRATVEMAAPETVIEPDSIREIPAAAVAPRASSSPARQFARDYPAVELEITTDDSRVDLVSAGYDADIQFGEYIAQDMVAVRVSPDLRPAVVGPPAYFAAHPRPTSPRDVLHHQCIRFRHLGEGVYKWEFDKGDESLAIAVNGPLLLDELDLVIQAALDGAGLAWVAEDRITDHLASGALVRVLEDWCPPFPEFFL